MSPKTHVQKQLSAKLNLADLVVFVWLGWVGNLTSAQQNERQGGAREFRETSTYKECANAGWLNRQQGRSWLSYLLRSIIVSSPFLPIALCDMLKIQLKLNRCLETYTEEAEYGEKAVAGRGSFPD